MKSSVFWEIMSSSLLGVNQHSEENAAFTLCVQASAKQETNMNGVETLNLFLKQASLATCFSLFLASLLL
jgi:hypothetical protein